MLTREFTHAGHTDRFIVTRGESGWDVRETRDDNVVKTTIYQDWHRVERAMQVFELFRRGDLVPAK